MRLLCSETNTVPILLLLLQLRSNSFRGEKIMHLLAMLPMYVPTSILLRLHIHRHHIRPRLLSREQLPSSTNILLQQTRLTHFASRYRRLLERQSCAY